MGHADDAGERTVIEHVRDLMPRRPLSLAESYSVAERQAYKLLELLEITAPHVTYDKLLQLPTWRWSSSRAISCPTSRA